MTSQLLAIGPGPGTGSSAPPWVTILVLVFMAVVMVLSVVQYRRRGPNVGWVPRRWRARVNAWYARHDYPLPFDDEGKRIQPVWTKRSDR